MSPSVLLGILLPAGTVWLSVLYADWRAHQEALQEAAWTAALDRYAGRPTRPDLVLLCSNRKELP